LPISDYKNNFDFNFYKIIYIIVNLNPGKHLNYLKNLIYGKLLIFFI